MARRPLLIACSLLVSAHQAWAGDVTVVSVGAPVVVLRGGQVVGTTPFTLAGVPEGNVELGFREAPLSATAFSQVVAVPATGTVQVQVNLAARTASTGAPGVPVASAPAPAASTAAPAPAAGAPAPAPPAPALAGDLYVTSTPSGAAIFVDGASVNASTPFVVRGVSVGTHAVDVRTTCGRASASIPVLDKTIARAELTLVDRPGAVMVSAGAAVSRVFLDGADVGLAPLTLDAVGCGKHTLAFRAPGYLEAKQTLDVAGEEVVDIALTVGATAAPPPAAKATRTVTVTLQKEEFGTLVLDVTPLETTLDVDGIVVGAGPRSIDKIAVGPHVVTGKLDGYATQAVDVSVLPNAVARANLALVLGAPVAATTAPREPKAHGKAGRIGLNLGVTAVGLGAGIYGATRFAAATTAYHDYQTVPSDSDAEVIYAERVVPARIQAWVGGGIGLAAIVAGTGLWVTTSF